MLRRAGLARSGRPQERLPTAIIAAFVVLAVSYSVLIPPWEAVDEIDHFHYAHAVMTTGRLPEQSAGGQPQPVLLAHHPPLYYLMLGLVIAPFGLEDPKLLVRPNPDFRWGDPSSGGYNRVFHGGPAEQFPYSGPVRALHVGRLLSVAGGVLVLLATWRTALLLTGPAHPGQVALAMGLVAFLPGFLVSAATVHHDIWVAAFAALGVWRTLAFVRAPTAVNLGWAALLFGLTTLTKASGLALAPLLPLAVALAWLRAARPGGAAASNLGSVAGQRGSASAGRSGSDPAAAGPTMSARRGLWFLLVAALVYLGVVGWWLVRNQALYGDPLGWGPFSTNPLWPIAPKPVTPESFLAELVEEWAPASPFWRSLVFGAGQMVFGQEALLIVAFGIVALGLAGLGWRGWSHRASWRVWLPEALLSVVAVGLVVAAIGRYALTFFGPNGRYFFPALPLLAIGVALGWQAVLGRRFGLGASGLVLASGLLAALTPPLLFLPLYTLQNRLSADAAAALAPNRSVQFGDAIELVRADLDRQRARPGDAVTVRLVWRAKAEIPRSYRAFVHLVGFDGRMLAGHDGAPGAGAASTALWRPGDLVADEVRVQLPADARPGLYEAVTGFYRFPDLERLPASGPDARPGQTAGLGQVKVLPMPPAELGPARATFGQEVALVDAQLPAQPPPGRPLAVRLTWQALARPSADYTVSVQLVSAGGQLVAQQDAPPLGGALPTTVWEAGDVVPDLVEVQPPPAASGSFSLHLVIYHPGTGQRLRTADGADAFVLGTVELGAPGVSAQRGAAGPSGSSWASNSR